ncbi:hypothetical protein [Candidatus Pelagibacter communis]|uniref:hypothetical protein n=1 Tax=Pelagibacter ubique TaxID=198252 RepID=UPI0012BD43B3|nr:hypothetical protein [Candidatus Pelagibacter ubique]
MVKIQSVFEPLKTILFNKKNINTNEFKPDENNKKIIIHKNLSSDVWLKSIKIAFITVPKYPIGVGLNNYELAHNKFIGNVTTSYKLTKKLNIQDASNNLMKIIVEFGLFSFFLFYLILKFAFSKKIELKYKIFLLPNIFTQLLIRGAGYFNGGFVIFIIVMTYLIYEKEID